mgnify:CR=1 FL=1
MYFHIIVNLFVFVLSEEKYCHFIPCCCRDHFYVAIKINVTSPVIEWRSPCLVKNTGDIFFKVMKDNDTSQINIPTSFPNTSGALNL